MMSNVRTKISYIHGVLMGLVLLSAPFLVTNAQEDTSPTIVEEEVTVTTTSTDRSAEAFGIKTENIPNASDVIGDFVVGPGKFETMLKPGESRVVEVTITNRTGIDRVFNLETEDAAGTTDGSDALILLGNDRGPYSIKDYITFPTDSFELPHGKRARVPVTISVPYDAEPGGLYGSLLVNTVSVPDKQAVESGAAAATSPVVQRIGVLFLITVPGDSLYEGTLQDFSTIPRDTFYDKGPINFVITYENSGVAHLNPYGELRITNMFDEEVGFVELEPWFALPQSVRLREVSWNRDMLYGRYTATIYLNRGYDDIIDEMSITFWVIPWKIVLGVVAVVFLIFFIIRGFFRKFEFKRKDS